MDYDLPCSIKGAVKKVGRANFGYYRSPALTTAGKRVIVWKAIWSCKRRKQPMSKIIKNNIDITELLISFIKNEAASSFFSFKKNDAVLKVRFYIRKPYKLFKILR